MASRPIIPLPAGQNYRRFSLSIPHAEVALLPAEHEFTLNPQSGHYIVINWANRYVVADGVFYPQELPLVLTLLDGWPSYVPNEKLAQAITGRPPEEIAEAFFIAYDAASQLLCRIVEACQERFRQIGIRIEDTYQLGYKLGVYTGPTADN